MKRTIFILYSLMLFIDMFGQQPLHELLLTGAVKTDKGDFKGAILDYNRYINANPNDPQGYLSRGRAKDGLKDFNGSIDDYSTGIRIWQEKHEPFEYEPNYQALFYNRAASKIECSDFVGSIADISIFIKLDTTNADAYCMRGWAKYSLDDYRGAILDDTKAIQINPNYALAYQQRGFAHTLLRNNTDALEDLNKAIRINPNLPDAYYGIAILCILKEPKDYEGAISNFSICIKLKPNSSDPYLERGNAKLKIGDKEGACLDWSKAGELGDNKAYDQIKKYCKN